MEEQPVLPAEQEDKAQQIERLFRNADREPLMSRLKEILLDYRLRENE